ncbi:MULTISPECIES: nickel ABC transporter substrate-binding protein [Paenibacillus]|uniref:staphylopine-dependent metal ABC transporter substrate-binding lipoprotein n=1 Tax=Paenibacillus TaxID=44249 RepID=UPI0006D00D9E|nr:MULTISPECIES: nickel ABC transporter substrate-binding protein [Paenibacillus]NTZ17530.1 nickel ABC transporter, nickel/metallophore periplasmic binding protein [Paenibacillus sp. JMULE4]GCL74862.1 nickel ABC transporter, nickel/metallophore periplasmic binding protein [Paenibacillus naphthalenovorans]
MKRIKAPVLLVSLLVIVLLAGCSGGNNNKPGAAEQTRELVYAAAKDINDMNPHLYPGSMAAQAIVYESLVENTPEGIKPLLAESWDISEDGKVYTFHLRKNVKFHDGEPFNAEAVKLNIEAVQSNAAKHAWIKLSTVLDQVDVIDEHTVQLTLKDTYYPTLLELSMTRPYVFLSPKDFLNGETKDGVAGYNGTGPYKLDEHVTEQFAKFSANEDYWGGVPAIKTITAKVLPAGETTLLALQKGEVNFVFTDDRGADSIDVEAMQRLADSGDYQIVRSEPMNTKMIVANSSNAASPVSEKAVREAIWLSIDRETISRTIFSGTEAPAETLFSSNVNYADVGLPKRDYNPEGAAKLLEEAGWTNGGGAAVRTKDGRELAMKLYYDVNSSSQKTQAELLQSEAGKIGMKLELVGEESQAIANRRSTGDYDLLFNQTWGLAYDPQSTIAAFASESAYLHTTSGIPQAEELYRKINEVMLSTDEDARKALYKDILTIVHDEAVFIPLTNGSVTVVAPKDLQGISFKQTQFELPFERMSFK